MTDGRLIAPALLTYVYVPTDGPDAAAGWAQLRSLWRAITDRLGLDHPIPRLNVPVDLPAMAPTPGSGRGMLAAAERDAPEVWQALVRAEHDVLCLALMMALPRDQDCARAWSALEHRLDEIGGWPSDRGTLGQARLFLGLHSGALITPGSMIGLVRDAAPGPSAVGWWTRPEVLPLLAAGEEPDQLLVLEIGPSPDDARPLRRLALVVRSVLESRADELVWTSGDGELTPLARHLLHAAKLRYQLRVFDDGRPSRQVRDDLDLLLDRLLDGRPTAPPGLAPHPDDGILARLERKHAVATTVRARLGAMRRSVGIIAENLRAALPASVLSTAAEGPLGDDSRLGEWLIRRLDDEIGCLDAAVEHVREVLSRARRPDPEEGARRAPAGGGTTGRRRAGGRSCGAAGAGDAGGGGRRVVVFTALETEYEAVRAHLTGALEEQEVRGTLYEVGTLGGRHGAWRLALAQTGSGGTPAGVHVERSVNAFSPDVVLYVGIAGGRKDVTRGDVVAADAIYDYESGKAGQCGYRPRIGTLHSAYRLVQYARGVARRNGWQRRIKPACPEPTPRAFVGPIATGAKVVTNERSAVARLLDRYIDDAFAVEREGHGFLHGAYVNPDVDALVIRGISALVGAEDEAGGDRWQRIAGRHAAAFAIELLDVLGPG